MPGVLPMERSDQSSLRERNKARARTEIANVALALFSERGFEAVTVDDVVAAVGVSRRTFFRYFESKEDALLADYPMLLERLREALLEDVADRPVLDAIRDGLHRVGDFYEERREAVLARSRVIKDAGGPAARNLEMLSHWEAAIAEVVAKGMGAGATDLVPRTVAATVVGAFRAALSQWVRAGGVGDLHELIDQTLDVIEHGLRAAVSPAPL